MRRALAALLLLAACHSPSTLAAWEEHVGPPPNVRLLTLGGSQLWADVAWRDGWRVQRHAWSRHHRLLDPQNVRQSWGTRARCLAELRARAEPEPEGTHLVVLLHGLGRTRASLAGMEGALQEEGWRVARLSYPSTRGSIARHAEDVSSVLENLDGVTRLSLVTHSLGGVVALEVLGDPEASWRERLQPAGLVQLAPPNHGSSLARSLDVAPLSWVLGRAFTELAVPEGRDPVATDLTSTPITVVTGVGGGNPLVPGSDDLVVALEEARLPGADVHALPGALHTFVMDDSRAQGLVLRALQAVREPPQAGAPANLHDRAP